MDEQGKRGKNPSKAEYGKEKLVGKRETGKEGRGKIAGVKLVKGRMKGKREIKWSRVLEGEID